jgi:hypothetical protein
MSIDELLQVVTEQHSCEQPNNIAVKKCNTNSYAAMVIEHIEKLGVAKDDKKRYRAFIHKVMGEAGVIDTLRSRERYKPFENSPYGEFTYYLYKDGKRDKKVDTFILNEEGKAKVSSILNLFQDKYVTDKTALEYRKELQSKMNYDFLKHYFDVRGIKYYEGKDKDRLVFKSNSVEKDNTHLVISYTCYQNNPTKCQYENTKKRKLAASVFQILCNFELSATDSKKTLAEKISRIHREWWNFQFNNTTSWVDEEIIEHSYEEPVANPVTVEEKIITNTSTSPSNDAIMKRLDKLEQMLHLLLNHHGITIPSAFTDEIAEVKESVIPTTKEGIIQEIEKTHKPLEEQRRYKNLTQEVIDKEKNSNSKKKMQEHYNLLEERRLNTAKYKPLEGWKWDSKKGIIPLLYKISDRRTATYNTRQRRVQPFLINGDLVKEKATSGEHYSIPYGLDKIDYTYKTIFVTEGCFDSCFLKNCLAYSNWILPNTMTEVIELYRNAGFQIIHILDNYRIGDKGGKQGLACMVKNRDWFEKGDKVFDWSVFSDDKDLNDIAIHYELDEIDANTIINHSVGYEEALALYHEFCNEE